MEEEQRRRPTHQWNVAHALYNREIGASRSLGLSGSLHSVERLELLSQLRGHDGCVNALHWSPGGQRLLSASDDLRVATWDPWAPSPQPLATYPSGHSSNVFQAKYVPLCGECQVATCARDGQVRLGTLSPDGTCIGTRKLLQHKGSAHRISVQQDCSHHLLTCGEDAAVYSVDLRQDIHNNKIVVCKSKEGKKVPLYSIFINPYKTTEFVVAGRTQFVKIYDTRFLQSSIKELCPAHLVGDDKLNVTSVVYNHNGQEILASYNDEDIYLFCNSEPDGSKFSHRYRGHRNYQTVKGVNFFGSEFVVSGSDCGYLFFWEKHSEHIVNYLYADEGGAVNCLEVNPVVPVLATSGLDNDVKIWVPSADQPPDLSQLDAHVLRNVKGREEEREYPDGFADHTIWLLMQHLSRARRMAHRHADEESADESSSSSDEGGVSVAECNQS